MDYFKDKVIIITGATAGIGKQLALMTAAKDVKLVLAARNSERLLEVENECRKKGAQTLSFPTDVSSEEDCRSLVEKSVEKFGAIDILVNNAGITMWARFDELKSPAPAQEIMQTNYMGSVYCTFYALPRLKKSRGQIIAISSLTGKTGVPTRTAYSASKHAMAGFFDSLRIELAGSGVDITTIYPGFVATEVRERALGPDGKPLGESPMNESGIMPVEECAAIIINAIKKRKREVVMTLKGKAGLWLKLIAPGLVDKIALKSIMKDKKQPVES